jgi:hypothetical protein
MDRFHRNALNELLSQEAEPCLSLFLPVHRAGRDAEQNPIRLKNMLHDAESQLIESGMRGSDVRALLADVSPFVNDTTFWRQGGDGLALYIAPGFQRFFRVPLTLEEKLHIGSKFCVQPLLPLLYSDGVFYVLSLSMKKVRFYRGTRQEIREIELPGVADNMADAVLNEDVQSHLQHRSWGARRSGVSRAKQSLGSLSGSGAVFHGQGSDEDARKAELGEFCKQIAAAVSRQLNGERSPLILACVEYEAPIYRSHNHYAELLEEFIAGNPEQLTAAELHERAWKLAEPYFRKTQEHELAKFNRLSVDRISTDMKLIAEAAEVGRVEALFIPQRNGNGQPKRKLASVDTSATHEIVEEMVAQVLRTGGDVFTVTPEMMPQDAGAVAAVFRYSLP